MRHLGLDFSLTSTGIAVWDSEAKTVLHHERVGESLSEDATEIVQIARMIGIAKRVLSVVTKHEPQTVTIEGPAYGMIGGGAKMFQMGGLHYVVAVQLRLCFRLVVPMVVPAPTARKVVLGRGIPPKGIRGQAAVKKWVAGCLRKAHGIDLGQHDANDALVMALYRASLEPSKEEVSDENRQGTLWGV